MARTMMTICEYIINVRKKDTIYIVFNEVYNKVLTKRKKLNDMFELIDKKNVDYKTREEFLKFMKENLPNVKLTEVGDYLPLEILIFPYLGTIAIDVDINSKEYEIITEKWGNLFGEDFINDTTLLWVMKYIDALEIWEERKKTWEEM
ncbi:hypothetical protein [Nautilia lithotrophica]